MNTKALVALVSSAVVMSQGVTASVQAQVPQPAQAVAADGVIEMIGPIWSVDPFHAVSQLVSHINSSRNSEYWTDVETLAWYGIGELGSLAADDSELVDEYNPLLLYHLTDAQKNQAFLEYSQGGSKSRLATYEEPVTMTRDLALPGLLGEVARDDLSLARVNFYLLSLANARSVAELSDSKLASNWEEHDGDLISLLPTELQEALPRGLKADDNYYRAASLLVTGSDYDRKEVTRLLTKIDDLEVSREDSSFHLASIMDSLFMRGQGVNAYQLGLQWFNTHPTEEGGRHIIDRIAVYGVALVGSEDLDGVTVLNELELIVAKYPGYIRGYDMKKAAEISKETMNSRQLTKWENQYYSSTILHARAYLALLADTNDAQSLATLYLTNYPFHPSSRSVQELLSRDLLRSE